MRRVNPALDFAVGGVLFRPDAALLLDHLPLRDHLTNARPL